MMARAQQPAMPVIGYLSATGPNERLLGVFRQNLAEAGYVEGRNVAIEYRWAEGYYGRLPGMAASAIGVQIEVIRANDSSGIDAAFATLVRNKISAVVVGADPFFFSRRLQFATQATRHAIPAVYTVRESPEAGGLMSYGTSLKEVYQQLGAYAGRILKGAKPTDLPVVQMNKFEFVINLPTARALGLSVPPLLLT